MEAIGKRLLTWKLKEVMRDAAIGNKALAQFLEVDEKTISRWRGNYPQMSLEKWDKLLYALNILKSKGYPLITLDRLAPYSMGVEEMQRYLEAESSK